MTKAPVLILGSHSDIGKAVARKFAALGHPIQLAARHSNRLSADKQEMELRYQVLVSVHEFDALATKTYASVVADLPGLPHVAICVVGLMGSQEENERNIDAACRVIRSNFEGPASIMAVLAESFVERGSGTLVGIRSVAGERGRATNYVYGAAKSGFTTFLSGLRNRLAKQGVHVVTVLPGFVATRMTEGMKLPTKLTAQPEEVADAIVRAVYRNKNIVYVRPIWQLIMSIVRNIPESVFKRMKI